MTLADKLIRFHLSLRPPQQLPKGIEVLFPQQDAEVKKITKEFYKKFFDDGNPRRLMFGINPGRFGAGITGINFTAPKQLAENCGIIHPFKISSELSAEFIYEMIEASGGAKKFYSEWIIAAASPLGFVKNGKNINYYDDRKLAEAVTPFIEENISRHISFGSLRQKCICIGEGKNHSFLSMLNEKHQWFREIVPLPHPRFVMQYRRKQKKEYIDRYLEAMLT